MGSHSTVVFQGQLAHVDFTVPVLETQQLAGGGRTGSHGGNRKRTADLPGFTELNLAGRSPLCSHAPERFVAIRVGCKYNLAAVGCPGPAIHMPTCRRKLHGMTASQGANEEFRFLPRGGPVGEAEMVAV